VWSLETREVKVKELKLKKECRNVKKKKTLQIYSVKAKKKYLTTIHLSVGE